jgi:hypothetical protein
MLSPLRRPRLWNLSQCQTAPLAKALEIDSGRNFFGPLFPLWPRIEVWRMMKEFSLINPGWRQVNNTGKTPSFTVANFYTEIQAVTKNRLLRRIFCNITKLPDTFQEKNVIKIS